MKKYLLTINWLGIDAEEKPIILGKALYTVTADMLDMKSRLDHGKCCTEILTEEGGKRYFDDGGISVYAESEDGHPQVRIRFPDGNLRWGDYKTVIIPEGCRECYRISHYESTMGDDYNHFDESYEAIFGEIAE